MRLIVALTVFLIAHAAWAQDAERAAAEAAAAEAAAAVEAATAEVAEAVEEAKPEQAADDTAKAGEDDADPKPPKPLSDEEVALIVEDELEAILLNWNSLNKSANVNLQTGQISRSMSFSAYLLLPNDTKVSGIGSQMFFTQAVNENGEEVLPNRMDIVAAFNKNKANAKIKLPRTSYYPPQFDSGQPSPYRSVSGSFGNMEIDAKSFKKLSGYVPVRIAAQSVTIDTENVKTNEWKDLAGNLQYMVHQTRDSSSYHETTIYFTRKGQPENQAVDMNKEPSVARVDILDGTGQPMQHYSMSNSTTSITHNNQRYYVYYMRPRVRKAAGSTPTTIRFHIALRMVEAPVMFEFEDVPLP